MSESQQPFGHQLYEELKRQGAHTLITRGLNYAGIQRLKAADRADVVKMFRGSGYAMVQRLKQEDPEAVARLLVAEAQRGESAVLVDMAIMFMGVMIT